MKKISEVLVTMAVIVFMVLFSIFVCFIPNAIVQLNNVPELDYLSRIIGCIFAIPMLKLTLTTVDWVSNLKYWRD